MGCHPDDYEDLFFKSVLKMWEKRNELIQDTLDAYLYVTLRNAVIDKNKYKKATFCEFIEEYHAPVVYESLGAEENEKKIRTMLSESLTKKEATVIVGNFYLGKKNTELMSELNVSSGRIAQIKKSALKKLRKEKFREACRD